MAVEYYGYPPPGKAEVKQDGITLSKEKYDCIQGASTKVSAETNVTGLKRSVTLETQPTTSSAKKAKKS